jgi:hypothetical protein
MTATVPSHATCVVLSLKAAKSMLYSSLNLFRVILDGEMIAWDPITGTVIPFGNLKTAALSEKENRTSETGIHPLCLSPSEKRSWQLLYSTLCI